jgi:hypothetical protein
MDRKIRWPILSTATNLVPSAEAATEYQLLLGAPLGIQLTPELVEM